MRSHTSIRLSFVLSWMLMGAVVVAAAQGRGGRGASASPPLPSDPLSGPVVTGAPYSGETVTTITQTLGDGTRIEQRAEAKFYRDGAGRIRREETIIGLPGASPSAQSQTVITIEPTPEDMFAYTLDPSARTARRVPRGGPALSINLNGAPFVLAAGANQLQTARAWYQPGQQLNQGLLISRAGAPAAGRPVEESLGTRQIEGVTVTGRKTTTTIRVGQIGNDRPIEITDEQWVSPELKLVVSSRFSDPRTGVVEFRLTNISRAEPTADLFTVPSDYTVLGPPEGARAGGARTGGPGRGPQ